MKSTVMETIEKQLPLLTTEERLTLIEQLAHGLRQARKRHDMQAALAAMAGDPQIQAEIRQIAAEFAVAEQDGLEAN